MEKTSESPNELTDKNVKNIVQIGNAILPMLPKNKKDRKTESKFISYLLSSFRDKMISKQGRNVVNHADLMNCSDMDKEEGEKGKDEDKD